MRIAYICADPGVPVFGHKGCSIHVQEVVRTLLRYGHEVDLFAARIGGPVPQGLDKIRIHRIPGPRSADPVLRECEGLAANSVVRMLLARAGPFDMVYERYSLWSCAGMEFSQKRGIPGVLEVNAPLIEEQDRYRDLINRAGACDVARRVFWASDVLLAVSSGVAAYLATFSETHGKVTVINNGVDSGRFQYPSTSETRRARRPLLIGFVGSLKPWHGVDVLINAFARFEHQYPDSRVLLVGDGPERANAERLAEALQLNEKIELTGAVPPSRVSELLSQIDVAVAPYADECDFYFSPLKLFEYMAAGCAIVASRIGQISHVIDHGIDGLLCDPGDPTAFACSFNRLALDPGLRKRLGCAARAKAIREHSWDHVVQRTLGAVQGIVSPQVRARAR